MNLTLTEAEYQEHLRLFSSLQATPEKFADAVGRDALMAFWHTHGLRNLYFFVRSILSYPDLTTSLHGELCGFASKQGALRRGYLIPRSHFKSTCVTIGKSLWTLMRDERRRIAIFHEKATQSEQFLGQIKYHLSQNRVLNELYPERIPPYKKQGWRWSASAINIPRTTATPEPSIYAAGQGSALQGMHYDHIILDDIIGEEAAHNPDVMEKVIDWLKKAEALFDRFEVGELDLVGTRWAPHDVYEWAMENRPGMEWFVRSAIINEEDPDTGLDIERPLFPERFTLTALHALAKEDYYIFSCQYLNSPTPSEKRDFEDSWLRFYTKETRNDQGISAAWIRQADRLEGEERDGEYLSNLAVYIHCDPGIGMREGHRNAEGRRSLSAITVVGICAPRKIFVLHTWAKVCTLFEYIDQIIKFFQAYDAQLRTISIEAHSWTEMIRPALLQRASERGIFLTDGRVEDYKKSANQRKESRIRKLQPFFARGQVFIEEGMNELRREYRMFPLDPPWDVLDSLAQGPDYWVFPDEGENQRWEDGDDPADYEDWSYEQGRSATTGY